MVPLCTSCRTDNGSILTSCDLCPGLFCGECISSNRCRDCCLFVELRDNPEDVIVIHYCQMKQVSDAGIDYTITGGEGERFIIMNGERVVYDGSSISLFSNVEDRETEDDEDDDDNAIPLITMIVNECETEISIPLILIQDASSRLVREWYILWDTFIAHVLNSFSQWMQQIRLSCC